MPLATQSRLGPYEVISLLGAGAMGEVYRARDTRLHRDVAIKILDDRSGDDETSLRRFEQEARAASALNHPNVVTIHDVGREDQLSYIVTEFVEGESLRSCLTQNSQLPMRQVLDIGIQISEGLAAAHDHGIIHRDLKPENIMVTRDGRVKILDFGLAKPVDEQAFSNNATHKWTETAPGVIFGTAAYMSPEQAKGGPVRFYADQFALGVILYEMTSGIHPFKRESALQTLSAILTEDTPPLTRGSAPFQWLVRRCLHREPDHRYSSTGDITRELKNIREHLTGSMGVVAEPVVAPEETTPRPRNSQPLIAVPEAVPEGLREPRWVRPVLWLTAVALAGVFGYLVSDWIHRQESVWHRARFVPFATSPALEVFPAWGPNSRSIAYSADVNGVFQIFLRSNGTSIPAQLTRSSKDCFFPFWSPDGIRIYFISEQTLWSIGATGGSPEKILDNVAQAAIAADGQTLAALRGGESTFEIWTGSIGGNKLSRYNKGSLSNLHVLPGSYLRFAPDGKTLGAWLSLANGRSEFWVIPFPDGEPHKELSMLEGLPLAREFTWMPGGKEIIYSERSGLSIGSHLWRADLRLPRIMPVTTGTGSELSPSVAANGRELAFSTTRIEYDVVRFSLDGVMENVAASPVFEVAPAISAQGHFAYVTDRSGQPEIWLKERGASWERPLVTASSFGEDVTLSIFDTSFSPDGRRIAYRRAGANDESIWISTITGDPPVRLAKERGNAVQRAPTWSPDGNSVAYCSIRNGWSVLMRARVGALEQPVVLAENAGTYPRWSPRGDWIASSAETAGLTMVSADGRQRKNLGSGQWLVHGWSNDGSDLFGVRMSSNRRLELVQLDPRTGAERVNADLGQATAGYSYGMILGALPLRGFAMAPDGKSFLTSVIRPTSDLWIMDRRK
jgi:eukaryotic-like serine/threonine-protein kinase